jgi:hypothetical protein
MQGKREDVGLREIATNVGGMRSNSTHSGPRGRILRATPRQQIWIENPTFHGFGCSRCNWVFKPVGAVVGETLEEMKRKYEAQRDKEFAAHVCGALKSPDFQA